MGSHVVYIVLLIFVIQDNLNVLGFTITGGHFDKNKHSCADIILVKNNVGPKMCVKHCILVNTCMAVNYIRNEHKCELLSTISLMNTLQHMDGSDYTDIYRWKMVRNAFC